MATLEEMQNAPPLSDAEAIRATWLVREASLTKPDVCIAATTNRLLVGTRPGQSVSGLDQPISLPYETITGLERTGVRRATLAVETTDRSYVLPPMATAAAEELESIIVEEAALEHRMGTKGPSLSDRALGITGGSIGIFLATIGLILAGAGVGLVLTIVGAALGGLLLLLGGLLAWGGWILGEGSVRTGFGTALSYSDSG
ncbi:MAG: hypothetical protein U5K37_10890 [Natrialbaceae archaeon]|nr:hypothetical protein [Natrialbaceae archaeon]